MQCASATVIVAFAATMWIAEQRFIKHGVGKQLAPISIANSSCGDRVLIGDIKRTMHCHSDPKLFGEVRKHGLTGVLGFGERLKGRSAYPDGSTVEIDGAPGRYKARPPVEARTAAALVTDYK
jgi:hypothetical protein